MVEGKQAGGGWVGERVLSVALFAGLWPVVQSPHSCEALEPEGLALGGFTTAPFR